MLAGPFAAGLKCSENVFLGFSSFAWQRGTLQLIAIHMNTLYNILEYMQIAICHALTFVILFMSLFWFGQGVSWGGYSIFYYLYLYVLAG